MSVLAGCYWDAGRPARADDLRGMMAAAAHRVRHPASFWCLQSVAIAYAGDTAASYQPFHDRFTRITAVLDGRLDNVEDLATALHMSSATPPAALVVAAYRRWDLDLGRHLLGDFAIAIHDVASQRVICVRDPMGQRPLFYGRARSGMVFASEPQQVLTAVGDDLNEAAIAEIIAGAPTTVGETAWRHVLRLPPAHTLEIDASGARLRRYWDFDPAARVRYRRDEEYDEHFRDLFTRAVACRVAGERSVGIFLSGGLDSSAVAAAVTQSALNCANKEAGSFPEKVPASFGIGAIGGGGGTSAPGAIRALSLTYPGRDCDESPYARAVAGACRLHRTAVDAAAPTREAIERVTARYRDIPLFPNCFAADQLRSQAAALGLRVVLTGFGGDDYFTGSPVYPGDILRDGDPAAAVRAVASRFLPHRARQVLRAIPGLASGPASRSWLRPEFARRVELDERLRHQPSQTFPTRDQQDVYDAVTALPQMLGDEVEERSARAAAIDQRHPFYDRRLAELALAIPRSQRWRGRAIKVIIRRALARHLPAQIIERQDKADFSHTYVQAIDALGGAHAFDRLESERAGWVDASAIRTMYAEMIALYSRGDAAYIALAGPLWTVAALEVWLARARSAGRAADRTREAR